MSGSSRFDELDKKLDRYENALKEVEKLDNKAPGARAATLDMLVARDDLYEFMHKQDEADKALVDKLCELDDRLETLDERLKARGPIIAVTISLDKWRERFNPPEDAWWWFFTPPVPPWDRYDWIWNALTAGVLALTASFMYNIYSAISVGNASIATTFSTIAQAAGLAIIGGGALSDKGQKKVQKILESLKIPPRFFAEATLILSCILLASVYTANNELDDLYFDSGVESYKEGMLGAAALAYEQGSKINPDSPEFNIRLGEVFESLGFLDKAVSYYQLSVQEGNYESLNDLGRAMINKLNPITQKSDPALAEGILLLGLQRAQTRSASDKLLYGLNRNVGWALLNQEKFESAEEYLMDAIALDEKIKETHPGRALPGSGMAYCFMAQVNESRGEKEKAGPMWLKCIDNARPEFIHEFRWFMQVRRDRIAYCVDTKNVVAGYEGKRSPDAVRWCDILRSELERGAAPR